MFSFLHAADLHLDSPLRGLSSHENAPVQRLREATRQALKNLVQEALDRAVDLVVIAGDVYDGDWKDYKTGLFFVSQMARLDRAGIPVVLISGNHDAESRITRSLELPENVTALSVDRPETVDFPELGVAVHGQGFKDPAIDIDLSKGYPPPTPGRFNIGLLHTNTDGREGHDNYAPCSLAGLRAHGYHYWALGHIHQREVLSESPWVVYPGNLQGRHARETGPKGATLVQVDDAGAVRLEHLVCDDVRWQHSTVDISGLDTLSEAVHAAGRELERAVDEAGPRLLAARITTVGAGAAHLELARDPGKFRAEVMARALSLKSEGVWLEKLKLESRPTVEFTALAQGDPFFSALSDRIADLEAQPELLEELGAQLFAPLRQTLPAEWREQAEGLGALQQEALTEALSGMGDLLASELSRSSTEAAQ